MVSSGEFKYVKKFLIFHSILGLPCIHLPWGSLALSIRREKQAKKAGRQTIKIYVSNNVVSQYSQQHKAKARLISFHLRSPYTHPYAASSSLPNTRTFQPYADMSPHQIRDPKNRTKGGNSRERMRTRERVETSAQGYIKTP